MDKPLFKVLLGQNLHMTEEGWRVLTTLWIVYFIFVAGVNEYVRHAFSFEGWAAFKVFGLAPFTAIYAIPQIVLLRKYRLPAANPKFIENSTSRHQASAVEGAAIRQPSV